MPSLPFRSLCGKLRASIKSMPAAERAKLDGTLPHLIADGASYSYRIAAADFVRLCAQVGLDPLSGKRIAPSQNPGRLCVQLIGAGCAMQRELKSLSLRAAAAETGLSPATLSRIEKALPTSIESILAACEFIGVHPFQYMANEKREAA